MESDAANPKEQHSESIGTKTKKKRSTDNAGEMELRIRTFLKKAERRPKTWHNIKENRRGGGKMKPI